MVRFVEAGPGGGHTTLKVPSSGSNRHSQYSWPKPDRTSYADLTPGDPCAFSRPVPSFRRCLIVPRELRWVGWMTGKSWSKSISKSYQFQLALPIPVWGVWRGILKLKVVTLVRVDKEGPMKELVETSLLRQWEIGYRTRFESSIS